jgi:hypothetical protein
VGFETEFSGLLSPGGWQILVGEAKDQPGQETARPRVWQVDGAIDSTKAHEGFSALDAGLSAHLIELSRPVPAVDHSALFDRGSWIDISDPASASSRAVEQVGVLETLSSASLRQFIEQVTAYGLSRDPIGRAIAAYGHGDYVGPHVDVKPGPRTTRGFVRVIISFCNDAVAQQWLVHEHDGHLNALVDVARRVSMNMLHLPLWHQVTPLIAVPGHEADARRWIIAQDFEIVEDPLFEASEATEWQLRVGLGLQWHEGQLYATAGELAEGLSVAAEFVPLLDAFSGPCQLTAGVASFLARYTDADLEPTVVDQVWAFVESLQQAGILIRAGTR